MSTGDLIRAAVQNAGYKEDIANVLCNLNGYMNRKQWWGACHASCSTLYVALSELGYSPKLCIGEMLGQGLYFDHSWIELDGQILDIAISMTLLGGAPVSEPIVFGKNIRSGKESVIKYGVPGRGIEGETLVVNSLPFIDYMDGFPDEKNGLWGVVQELLGRKVDIPVLREKYQCKLPLKTQLPSEIAAAAFRSFKERYSWNTKVRAGTVRAIELSPKDSAEQHTLIDNVQHRMTMEKVQDAVEEIRGRFGKSAITYACLMGDLKMPTDGRDKVKMPGLMHQ